jgi:hypothetical protein
MRRTAVIAFGIVLASAQLLAVDTPSGGALINDITLKDNDSRLVRAAKLAVANRARMTVHSARVIDNDSLRAIAGSSHFSVATTAVASIPALPALPAQTAAPVSRYQQTVPANTNPVITTAPVDRPFELPPPPPPTNPIPYRPQP